MSEGNQCLTESFLEDALAAITFEELLTPEKILKRYLSIRSEISTSCSFSESHKEAVIAPTKFRSIGAGTCGTVFEIPGSPLVYKVSNHDSDWLWNEFVMYKRVSMAFKGKETEVHVPRLWSRISKTDEDWWTTNLKRFPTQFQEPANTLCIERILPLPKPIREAITHYFCPKQLINEVLASESNKDCLIRLYMGKKRPGVSRFFKLRNFILYLDDMQNFEIDTAELAIQMAHALAIMHWVAGIDANDVEFVLGSSPQRNPTEPLLNIPEDLSLEEMEKMPTDRSTWDLHHRNFRRHTTHLWLLDFNRCGRFEPNDAGVQKLVRAFFDNDPYYPRPHGQTAKDQQLWCIFRDCYLQMSTTYTDQEQRGLPAVFIGSIVDEQRKRMENRRDTRDSEF